MLRRVTDVPVKSWEVWCTTSVLVIEKTRRQLGPRRGPALRGSPCTESCVVSQKRSPTLGSCGVRHPCSSLKRLVDSWGPEGAPLCGDRHALKATLCHKSARQILGVVRYKSCACYCGVCGEHERPRQQSAEGEAIREAPVEHFRYQTNWLVLLPGFAAHGLSPLKSGHIIFGVDAGII